MTKDEKPAEGQGSDKTHKRADQRNARVDDGKTARAPGARTRLQRSKEKNTGITRAQRKETNKRKRDQK